MAEWPDTVITDEDLAAWIREHPEVWPYATIDDVEVDVDRVVDDVASGARERRWVARRRRRRIVAAGAVAVAIATGGTVAALVARSGQPARPEAGVVCRAEASLQADAVELGAGSDPIEGCRAEWEHGSFADKVGDAPLPGLVACIDQRGGAINVFPGDAGTCSELALEQADIELDAESVAVVALQDRLIEEINAAECAPAGEVADFAQTILDESGLLGWQVRMDADPATSVCAKVGLDTPSRTVFVVEL